MDKLRGASTPSSSSCGRLYSASDAHNIHCSWISWFKDLVVYAAICFEISLKWSVHARDRPSSPPVSGPSYDSFYGSADLTNSGFMGSHQDG